MTDYLTLAGTALNKQPRQLFGVATRTLKSSVLPRLPIDIDGRYERLVPEDLTTHTKSIHENTVRLQNSTINKRNKYAQDAASVLNGDICFLNETVSFENGRSISLDSPEVMEQSLHWKLKCWGFEHLKPIWLTALEPSEFSDNDIAIHRSWLNEWMGDHPIAADSQYLRRYWMPHSVCLRILNWARYDSLFASRLNESFREDIRRFVYKNAAFLSDNVEHGVGGNHLIENAVALVVAGSYFQHDSWLTQGQQILRRAATEQFFDDGGHVERSPMYHLIVTQRYLTSADLLASADRSTDIITTTAKEAVKFAGAIRPPDGEIPLLNDSVLNEALSIDGLRQYADACGLKHFSSGGFQQQNCPETGYYWLGNEDDCLLAVGGELAVEHLPAHAHAHPAQVLVWVDGYRILTDTGVFEYATGDARHYARSVRSHNTVQVDDIEPVRIGNSFYWFGNVATNVKWNDHKLTISYDVDRIGRSSYTHKRVVKFDPDGWTIVDDIEGIGSMATIRFHVHPDLTAVVDNDRVHIMDTTADDRILNIRFTSEENITVETAPYSPRYGVSQERDVVTVSRWESGQIETFLELC